MRTPDDEHASRLGELPDRVIVIAGSHRSGTTLMHRMLAGSGAVETITYLDVVEFPRLLDHHLRGRWDEVVAAWRTRMATFGPTRGIDEVPVGPLEPEEYGGVLRRSVVGIDGRRPYANLDFGPLLQLARKKRFLSAASGSPPRPLVLKNPVDTYDGVLRLDEVLPNATFLFVHRHPLAVLQSTVASWIHLLNEWNPWYAGLDRQYRRLHEIPGLLERARTHAVGETAVREVRDRIRTGMEHFLEVERRLPRDRVVSVRYEDLCGDPDGATSWVMDRLRLEGAIRPDVVARRPMRVGDLVRRVHDESIASWRPYLDRLGYADQPEGDR